ncbi:uncharacterized protein MELLADRAFT_96018 [Melampsora larici-populina 98AG31]|uniref:Tet-like 2OG-Fe(II) oxygenase domain-containing protein n=1 Tax=Melampsora larici-populina (strain 98AG31 / pathotype 3-4-7) TaxID=747676 RepID=F4SAL7_MELLP|nr:uncharacterized protein MELLADRAFT_96018 [Melampsora larici-populina 98AG31]EGF98314.1 hypothetical protein MELLADRAFT_96018 [Melampsora larici-populina 98AG31]
MTNLDPEWPKHKRGEFNSGKEWVARCHWFRSHGQMSTHVDTSTNVHRNAECPDENITLPGVEFMSDLLKVIDEKRQTGYTDDDLPKPFQMAKSYAHVPHEYLAPDGFPKSKYWLHPECKFAVVSKDNPNEGKGGVVRRALDKYRELGRVDVPPNPTLHLVKTRRKKGPRHAARAVQNMKAKGTNQSAQSANRINKTYDGHRYRLNDPILPYENYDRTMEIIHNTYKIITHGKGQFVDRDSHKLIFTYSFEDLETLTPEDRKVHQDDVSTISMSTKLFKRLPTPKPLTPPSLVNPSIPHAHNSDIPSSPLTSLPSSDAESEEDFKDSQLDFASQAGNPVIKDRSSSPLTSLPPSDAEGEVATSRKRKAQPLSTRDSDSKTKKFKILHQASIGQSVLLVQNCKRLKKRKVTTNAALIHGRMHCFGQTVGYSSNILTSPYVPPKGSSRSLYEVFLDRLPVLSSHIGGRFMDFCDVGFKVARRLLNELCAPQMASRSKSQPSGPLDFAANFAFTFGNFYNKPHTDNDKGKVYCLWYPIDVLSGRIVTKSEGFELEGGWFIFPEFRVAINFGGKSAVQIAWNGKSTFHHTIPSKERIVFNNRGEKVHYTRLGCSSQITYKMARASVKNGTDEQFNYTSNCERKVRDVEDILELPDRNWKI